MVHLLAFYCSRSDWAKWVWTQGVRARSGQRWAIFFLSNAQTAPQLLPAWHSHDDADGRWLLKECVSAFNLAGCMSNNMGVMTQEVPKSVPMEKKLAQGPSKYSASLPIGAQGVLLSFHKGHKGIQSHRHSETSWGAGPEELRKRYASICCNAIQFSKKRLASGQLQLDKMTRMSKHIRFSWADAVVQGPKPAQHGANCCNLFCLG